MRVRYTDFAPARATLKVTEIGENENSNEKPIETGTLNDKAVSMPKAVYSEEAKRLKLKGRVTVRVVVDENGKVTSALAMDGPAPLRQAAEEAARQATFKPMTEGGIVTKMTGVLTYDFP
jgi:TonB family protein